MAPPAPNNQAQPPPDRPFIFEAATPLEAVPQPELDDTGEGFPGAGDLPKVRRTDVAGLIGGKNSELGVIEQVEELGAKFELVSLADPRVLEYPEIPVVDPGSVKDITPKVPESSRATREGRVRTHATEEGVRGSGPSTTAGAVEPGISSARYSRSGPRVKDLDRCAQEIRALVTAIAEATVVRLGYVKRDAALQGRDSGDAPAPQEMSRTPLWPLIQGSSH